MHPIR
jgi:hypothetical protein